MHGTVLLDNTDQVIAPAIIWPDQRSAIQVDEITELIGSDRLIQLTGSPVATGFQAATIRWLQQKQPELWSRVGQVLLPKDYLRWRLTDEFATDPSDGSGTLLLDARHRDWSAELLTTLDIDPALLPPVQDSTAIAGTLTPTAAKALGLSNGIPVVIGAGDTPCSMLGAGIITSDTLLLTLSTGGQLTLPATELQVDVAGRIHTFCGPLAPTAEQPGWYQMAALLSAGLALRWLRDHIFDLSGNDAYAKMMTWTTNIPTGSNGLLFLPYLVGERTPHMDPKARGLFLGLAASHGQAELVRAVIEGVGLACFDAFSVLSELDATPKKIVMAGGGASSLIWRQIIADIFNLPVQQLLVKEQSAIGAILLAGCGIGLFDLGSTAYEWATYGTPLEPNLDRHAIYQELLGIFRNAYQKHREDFRRLQKFRQ
jgi:xylulokinase